MRDTDTTVDSTAGFGPARAGGTTTRYTTYDPAAGEVGVAVARAVGEALGRDPATLDPLAAVVDPDALEALVSAAPSPTAVTFEYLRYAITVSSDGVIELDPRSH